MKTVISILIAVAMSNWGTLGWAEEPPPTPAQEQPEVLTSGPVNEAFAEPVNLENQAGIIVPSQPPPNIDEVPPANKPVGDEFVWVPGYWGWDPSRNDYIWISGCWRAAPPRMYWVPGYWTAVGGGWQWVPGFWSPMDDSEITYLPEPPPLTDVGAPGPPPAADRIWVPPCWYWDRGRYVRRSGYWVAAHADWVWIPSHYLWTPRGYVFVPGYWDYSLRRRGVLFAPVFFPRHFHGRPRYSYPLNIVVDLAYLDFGLFTYPRYSHYYFGDYYGDIFIRIGLFPWFDCVRHHGWHDPIFFHDRWRHVKTNPRWEEHLRQDYRRRLADKRLRPARTYREMQNRIAKMPESQRKGFRFAEPMASVITGKKTAMKFEPLKAPTRNQWTKHSAEVRAFTKERSKWELQGPGASKGRPSIAPVPPTHRSVPVTAPMDRKEPQIKPQGHRTSAPPQAQTGHRKPEVHPQEHGQRGPAAPPRQMQGPAVRKPGGPPPKSGGARVSTPPGPPKRGGAPGPPSPPTKKQKPEKKKPHEKQENKKRDDTGEGERNKR